MFRKKRPPTLSEWGYQFSVDAEIEKRAKAEKDEKRRMKAEKSAQKSSRQPVDLSWIKFDTLTSKLQSIKFPQIKMQTIALVTVGAIAVSLAAVRFMNRGSQAPKVVKTAKVDLAKKTNPAPVKSDAPVAVFNEREILVQSTDSAFKENVKQLHHVYDSSKAVYTKQFGKQEQFYINMFATDDVNSYFDSALSPVLRKSYPNVSFSTNENLLIARRFLSNGKADTLHVASFKTSAPKPAK